MKGYIKVYRKVREKNWWRKQRFSWGQAWVDLLLRAMFSEQELIVDDKVYKVPAGSFVISQRKLAEDWKWGIARVNCYLRFLSETERSIDIKTEHGFTHIFILNWNKYQDRAEHQTDNKAELKRNLNGNKIRMISNENREGSPLMKYFSTLCLEEKKRYTPSPKDAGRLREALAEFKPDEIKKIFRFYFSRKEKSKVLSINAALSSFILSKWQEEKAKEDWQY